MSEVKKIATRASYGAALVELGKKHENLVVLDADLAAATQTGMFKKEFPERHIDCGIAESNMIGVAAGPFQFAMVNPVITKKSGEYTTEEGCLSLDGVRNCIRYEEIEVDYLNENFEPKHGKFSGYTAQIIQHEVDHCNGVVI